MSPKKWQYDERYRDRLEKYGKIRKRGRKTPKYANLGEEFEVDESKWPKLSGEHWFAARVVEVHKRYVFISVEPEVGAIDTRDVWLATIARRFLVADRAERNFVAVGDRVLCQPSEDMSDSVDSGLPRCGVQYRSPRCSHPSRLDPEKPTPTPGFASNIGQIGGGAM